ncbi:germination protein YpeB [Bacillus sp. HMF5848]|uniref:germination protein YpeB n=1 Tax=Bacillus sp. HMF5848 TaxID=2495421 RepID=UPI000F789334|nr:germination protein YpeB [Bacillus sp. HMF5848]RSK27453.1 germination protein YpeB [Bacillus sp. HMF5848]
MVRTLLVAVLAVGILGTSYWGYKEHQEKNAILIQAENNYQRAFHELTYNIDLLHDKIGSTLAMNSRKSLSPALVEVWRLTSEAQNDVGQLPLTLMPFNKTEEFLSNIGEFSYRTAVRDLEKEPLSEQEVKTLETLYSNAADIQKELRTVQSLVIENNLRWMDVELALAAGEEKTDNTIIDGLKTVEKNVESYSETDFGPTFTSMEKIDEGFKHLEGKEISAEEAKEIAKDFLDIEENVEINVVESGEGASSGFYSLSIQTKNGETYMDITKKGGYPIWVIAQKEVKNRNISLNDAATKASDYLKDHKFENQLLFQSAQYDNVGVFTFVTKRNNVRIYPEAIQVKVGLDEGEIMAFSARDYLVANKKREIPEPKITVDEAREEVNPNVKIQQENLSVIINELGEEVLCHEFYGTIGNDTYRIFINAESGIEEKVEKLNNAERIYQKL